MQDTNFDLRELLSPVDPDTFRREYWEKRPLVVRRGSPDYYRGLLSLVDVDHILSQSSIRAPQIRVLFEGKDIPLDTLWANELGGSAQVLESLYAEYRRGATVVLQFLHERWKPLTRLCRTLTADFSASFHVNAYLTPARERGLSTHYDTHDVFVLQTEGTKHWRVYEADPIRLPLHDQPFDSRSMKPGKLLEEFDLCSGDLLYIPRGYMHDAVSRDLTSLHLTVGVSTITWAAVVLRAVESVIEKDSRFRESLPVGFACNEGLRELAKVHLTELLATLVEHIEPTSIIGKAVQEALLGVQPVLEGHLLDLEALPRLALQTRVRRRPEVKWTRAINGDVATLYFHGKEVQMPAYTEPDLRFISEADEFRAADLPGELDDSGKLVLVQSLIREGLLSEHLLDCHGQALQINRTSSEGRRPHYTRSQLKKSIASRRKESGN